MIPVSKTLRREYSSYLQIILRKNVYEPEQLTDHNGLCKIKPKTRWTCSQSFIDDRPHFVILEQVHRDVLADRDVDELLGRVDQAEDGRQIVG
jgi:hypothetical protein